MKECTRCHNRRPVDQFSRFVHAKDGRSPWCKPCCTEKNREYYDANAEKIRADRRAKYAADPAAHMAAARARVEANPEHHTELNRKSHLKNMYSMTPDEYDAMLAAQGGGCAMCGRVRQERLCVDHDHSCCPGRRTCGECVRGLLCRPCNRLLGWFENNRESIDAYLSREVAA